METLYIKLSINETDTDTEAIRDAGLLFAYIAEATGLGRNAVEEIDEENHLAEIANIKSKYSRRADQENDLG